MASLSSVLGGAGRRSTHEMFALLNEVSGMLGKRKLVDLPGSGTAFLVGDLHGDPESLGEMLAAVRFVERCERDDLHMVFLGDYVDRGPSSLMVLEVLLELKKRFPERVILLRGNHETMEVNSRYGFLRECEGLGDEGMEMYRRCNRLFEKLPLCTLTENGVFAVHGGPAPNVRGRADLSEPSELVVEDLLWSDPYEKVDGYIFNEARGAGKLFGRKALEEFLSAVGARVLVRAHEIMVDGFSVMFGGKLLSLFSSKHGYYKRMVRRGAFAQLDLSKKIENAADIMVRTF